MLSKFRSIIEKNRAVLSAIIVFLFAITVTVTGCGVPTAQDESINEESDSEMLADAAASEPMDNLDSLQYTEDSQAQETSEGSPSALEEIKQLPAHSAVDTASLSEEEIDSLFYAAEINDEIFLRIYNSSYTENDNIAIEELSYIRVLHMGFDKNTYIGEMIVNSAVSEDIIEIMRELYRAEYPIESMVLVDEYGADDDKSMEANNTSAFNYRTISGTNTLSNHSYGLAIDVNPLYNPYIKEKGNGSLVISPKNAAEYADRSRNFPYKIDHDDLCYKLFIQHGFTWGGDWTGVKDYQHFERQ